MFDAVCYGENASYSTAHALQFLQHYEAYFKWKQNEEILEIGCANGGNTKHILYPFVEKHLKHLEAVDTDNAAIDVANSGNDKQNLTFSAVNIENQEVVNARKNKYDHIFSFYCLQLLSPKLWPKCLFDMTKPGGQVFSSIILSPNIYTKIMAQMAEYKKPWSKYFKDYKDNHHSYFGSNACELVTGYLTNAGFVVEMIQRKTVQGHVDSKEALQRALMSISTISNTFPADMREEYTNDFGATMLEHAKLNSETGAVSFDLDVVILVASKLQA